MIKYIYAFKNILSSNFGNPIFEVVNKDEAVEAFAVAAKEAVGENKERMKELDLYYFGTFDTKSGKCEILDPEFLISLKEVLTYGEGKKDNS